jgi:cytochrome c-type biogenesis protein CcmF
MTTAYISVFQNGKQIESMYPGRSVFRKHEDEEARTDVAIRRSLAQDLYLVLPPDVDFSTQTITLQAFVNPLVDWIWLGFGVLAFGTGIALLPERAYSFATVKLPAEAATTALVLLIGLALSGASLKAQQHDIDPKVAVTPSKNALEEQLRGEMGCVCGTCAHEALTKCTCGYAQQMRTQLRAQIDQGKNHDEIIQAFIGMYGGQQFLQAPIDKGFNRVAWLFPYLLGATGVVAIGFAAIKWSRHGDEPRSEASSTIEDAALEERINDELRDLD